MGRQRWKHSRRFMCAALTERCHMIGMNERENKTLHGRLFWASCELERSSHRIDALGTSLDALLGMMHESIPSDETLENLRIWLQELIATECGVLNAIHEEVGNVGRELRSETGIEKTGIEKKLA